MNKSDELEQLWQTQPVSTEMKGEEMRKLIVDKMEKFDRMIRRRNVRETVAAFLVAAIYFYATLVQKSGIARLGSATIVFGALYLVYYLWRGGAQPGTQILGLNEPSPDQTLAGYQHALVAKIDHQIRLLRSVKYWGLLPMFIGLLLGTVATLKDHAARGKLSWAVGIAPLIYTSVFAAIWWLNEVYGVRWLRGMRARVARGLQEGEPSACH